MTIHKPKSALHFLSEQPLLQTVIYDNHFKNGNDERPLHEFRNAMRDFARDYLKTFFADGDKELTQQEIEQFEHKYYGTL